MKTSKKQMYISTKNDFCPRCKCITAHSLFDYEKSLYKCNLCKTIHS